MENIYLTSMRQYFGMYMGLPVMVLYNFLFFVIGNNGWQSGIDNILYNFQSQAKIERDFQSTFAGNACEFYELNKRPLRIGVDKYRCEDIYQGVNTHSLGLGLLAHYERMDKIRGLLQYYFSDPNPEYLGEVPCFIPPGFPLVGWMMIKCTAREPI
jgi:hypothetical protein